MNVEASMFPLGAEPKHLHSARSTPANNTHTTGWVISGTHAKISSTSSRLILMWYLPTGE
jgi:hypothetical protein